MAEISDGLNSYMKDSNYVTPCVTDRTVDGIRVYSSSDLFVKHPTKEGLWKIHGRSDDQIMHSTGEKVCFSIHISKCWIFMNFIVYRLTRDP